MIRGACIVNVVLFSILRGELKNGGMLGYVCNWICLAYMDMVRKDPMDFFYVIKLEGHFQDAIKQL